MREASLLNFTVSKFLVAGYFEQAPFVYSRVMSGRISWLPSMSFDLRLLRLSGFSTAIISHAERSPSMTAINRYVQCDVGEHHCDMISSR